MRWSVALCLITLCSLAVAGEQNKDEAKAFLILAKSSLEKKDYDKAVEWLDKSKEKFDSAEAEEVRVQTLEARGQMTEALQCLRRAATLNSVADDLYLRGRLQNKLDEIEKALRGYETTRRDFTDYCKRVSQSATNPYLKAKAEEDLKKMASGPSGTEAKPSTGATKPKPTLTDLLSDLRLIGKATIAKTEDGVSVFSSDNRGTSGVLATSNVFKPPFRLEIDVKPEGDFRFAYGDGIIVLNWENRGKYILRSPANWDPEIVNTRCDFRPNTWHKVVLIMRPDSITAEIDGTVVATTKTDISKVASTLRFYGYKQASVIKSVKYSTTLENEDF